MYMYTDLEILDNTAKTCNDECHARTCSSSNSMSRTSKNGLWLVENFMIISSWPRVRWLTMHLNWASLLNFFHNKSIRFPSLKSLHGNSPEPAQPLHRPLCPAADKAYYRRCIDMIVSQVYLYSAYCINQYLDEKTPSPPWDNLLELNDSIQVSANTYKYVPRIYIYIHPLVSTIPPAHSWLTKNSILSPTLNMYI